MVEIKTLSGITAKQIHEAFSKAFEDYVEPFNLTIDQLKYMIDRRGFDSNLSFGAFAKKELVGFTLNGIGNWNGKNTAYDTGTGIIKDYRKQGIASRMFNESLPILKENKIEQYLLEVIKTNTAAVDLYKKAGFNITREFDYYTSTKDDLRLTKDVLSEEYTIKEIEIVDWDSLKSFWDFEPSWQNSIDSVSRKIAKFKFLGIFENNEIVGYGIIEKHTGDIPQFAISKEHRTKGLASILFKELIVSADTDAIKIINSEQNDLGFKEFTRRINLTPGHGQYEMILKL